MVRQVGFGIYDWAQILIRHPEAGSILPEKANADGRKLVFRSWKIAYRIDREAKAIYLVRVWHAAQDEIDIE